MIKLTYEYVYNYFKEQECELLETEYINAKTKMNYKCSNGHITTCTWNDFQQSKNCSICAGNQKHTYEYVYNYFKENGAELLSTEYINAQTNMKYKCRCGNISQIRFNSFKKGQLCMKCNGTEKFTYEYVKEYIESFNYKLLSNEYIKISQKLKVQCPNNHIYFTTFNGFKNNNSRCRKCFKEKNYGKNHPNWNDDRTRMRRAKYLSFSLYNLNILSDDPLYENYIQSQEKSNKSQTKIYDIDHIYPRIAFIDNNLDKIHGLKLIKEICNSRDNLRIIKKEDNLSKGSKYDNNEFLNWFNTKLNSL